MKSLSGSLRFSIPETPQALHRLFFVYIVCAFGIGWFLPINGAIWFILLVLSLFLFLEIRAIARGESGLRKRMDNSGAWVYLLFPVIGIGASLFAHIDTPYEELSVAQGKAPAVS